MKWLISLFSLGACLFGLYKLTDMHPQLKAQVEEMLDFGNAECIEMRYLAEQIMELNRKELLKESGARYLDPFLRFHPYLLLEVKFTHDQKTKEAILLWDLNDGEMVLDTKKWNKSRGFADCLGAQLQKSEFDLIKTLFQKGGEIDSQALFSSSKMIHSSLDAALKACIRKQLIVQYKGLYRLHLQDPKFPSQPETKCDTPLMTRPVKKGLRIAKRFSVKQIKQFAPLVFPSDFSIRKASEIYLPVHALLVQNADGSTTTTLWNGFSGRKLPPALFYE